MRYFLRKNHNLYILKLLALLALLELSGCGRKNNNFLVFENKEKEVKVNKLTLPSVRNISLTGKPHETIISWDKIDNAAPNGGTLIGYNLYRFIKTAFIPKNPINTQIIKKNYFVDFYLDNSCYTVRGLFKIGGKLVEGPASKIVCTNK